MGKGSHSLELGAGATIIHWSASSSVCSVSATASGMTGHVNVLVGYRYQPLGPGFQFRIGFSGHVGPGYGLITGSDDPEKWGFLPWGYISMGGTFGR